jgi:hypothetical protein
MAEAKIAPLGATSLIRISLGAISAAKDIESKIKVGVKNSY